MIIQDHSCFQKISFKFRLEYFVKLQHPPESATTLTWNCPFRVRSRPTLDP